MNIRFLLIIAALFASITPNFSQSSYKQMVDASATTLPYSENVISSLKTKLEKKMFDDLGWQDDVKWIKGFIFNVEMGAIDGKCGTAKGETFYFRTVIKDIQGEVQWDAESFSMKVSIVAEKDHEQKKENVSQYLKKLSNFDNTLYNFYKHKYDSIIIGYKIKLNELKDYNYSDYFQVKASIDQAESNVNAFLDKLTEIIGPIGMYESDFYTNKNCAKYYFDITSMAYKSVNEYEKELLENNISGPELDRQIQDVKIEVANRKIKNDSITEAKLKAETARQNTIKVIEEEETRKIEAQKEKLSSDIGSLEKDMETRIETLFTHLKKIKKNIINDFYLKGTSRQQEFYDSYLFSNDLSMLIKEYKLTLFNAANDDYKLQKLKYWDENLKYWEMIIK